jgi:hypothetical protein
MGAVISILLNFFSNHFSAFKLVLYGLFTFILPVILWNLFIEITELLLGLLASYFSNVQTPGSITLSFASLGSLAVWLAGQLRLGEAFTMLISGLTIRITVDIITRLLLR